MNYHARRPNAQAVLWLLLSLLWIPAVNAGKTTPAPTQNWEALRVTETNRLEIPDTFTLSAPGKDWVWSEPTHESPEGIDVHIVACQHTYSASNYVLVVLDVAPGGPNQQSRFIHDFLESAKKKQSRGNVTLENLKLYHVGGQEQPIYRFSADIVVGGHKRAIWFGYIMIADRYYIFQFTSNTPRKTRHFQKFVEGFRLYQ